MLHVTCWTLGFWKTVMRRVMRKVLHVLTIFEIWGALSSIGPRSLGLSSVSVSEALDTVPFEPRK